MAHFNLSHDNSRGKHYGVNDPTHAHMRGWHSGVNVEARDTTEDGDVFYVWMTSGSDQRHTSELIGVVKTVDNSPVFVPANDGRLLPEV